MTGVRSSDEWWRTAVIYQIYLRSFADGGGDGNGDIAGLRARLPYLRDLGVDGMWINPWYPSPLADGGYDVTDYRGVHPRFGSMAEAEAMIEEAHRLGLRVLLDLVPNHTSSDHPWFVEAQAAEPDHPSRHRYLFRPGRGPHGNQPPNNWRSIFGGPAWTRTIEPGPHGNPGHWYLHLFDSSQPDLNWNHPEVRTDFEQSLRFWFDRGVDGFRIDVAHALAKDPDLDDLAEGQSPKWGGDDHPFFDRAEVHEIYRSWRAIADSYQPPRTFVAETWVRPTDRRGLYVRPDELHTAFAFELIDARWTAHDVRNAIDSALAAVADTVAPATWVLSNHDVARTVSRFGRDQALVTGHNLDHLLGLPLDEELGRRRARAAMLMMLALPGTVYLYQGEELGLAEVEDLPTDALTDPTWVRSGRTTRGRDGCRVPLPWKGSRPPYGFGPPGAEPPWLPQPDCWGERSVVAQEVDPDSELNLYRKAVALRREREAFGTSELEWIASTEAALVLGRPGVLVAVNFGPEPLDPPTTEPPLLSSGPLNHDGRIPTDVAVWYSPNGDGRS